MFDSLKTSDAGHPAKGQSAFLTDFVRRAVIGDGLSDSELEQMQGITLAFTTPIDLVTLTNGFTESAAIAVGVTIGPSKAVAAELPSVPMTGVVILLALLTGIAILTIRSARQQTGR